MRVGRGDAERLRVSRPPPHPPQCAHWGTFPPVGGRLWGRSNREGFVLLWDVWIHILGIRAECACGGRAAQCAAPTAETWQARAARPGGRALQKGRRAHNVRPYMERGRETAPSSVWPTASHLPPRGGRLGKNKKGQVWDLPLETKRRSGASQKISLLTFFFKESKRLRR